jgi:hypothetical protein
VWISYTINQLMYSKLFKAFNKTLEALRSLISAHEQAY